MANTNTVVLSSSVPSFQGLSALGTALVLLGTARARSNERSELADKAFKDAMARRQMGGALGLPAHVAAAKLAFKASTVTEAKENLAMAELEYSDLKRKLAEEEGLLDLFTQDKETELSILMACARNVDEGYKALKDCNYAIDLARLPMLRAQHALLVKRNEVNKLRDGVKSLSKLR